VLSEFPHEGKDGVVAKESTPGRKKAPSKSLGEKDEREGVRRDMGGGETSKTLGGVISMK